MVATINGDCTTLTLNAEALVSAAGKTFDSLVLRSRLNCSSTESEVDVSSLIGSITAENTIDVPATLFYGDDTKETYCDGIYYFQLDITYTVDSSAYLVEDSACLAITCALRCAVIEYYLLTKDKTAWYYYYAITQGKECDSCYCTDMCSMYSELKILLNDNNITSNSDGCGCA